MEEKPKRKPKEFQRFEELGRKLVNVPKDDLRKAEKKDKEPSKSR